MIPAFDTAELAVVAELTARRYGQAIALEPAEVELTLEGGATLAAHAVYWSARGAQFVVCKLGDGRYRAEFFEGENASAASVLPEFDDLGDCVTALLRVQSDHERSMAGAVSGANAATLGGADYDGPVVI